MKIKIYGLFAKPRKSDFSLGIDFTHSPFQIGIGLCFWIIVFRWNDGKDTKV